MKPFLLFLLVLPALAEEKPAPKQDQLPVSQGLFLDLNANHGVELEDETRVKAWRNQIENNGADVFVKLEYFSPTGSYKDRMALAMIEGPEDRGGLRPGMKVVEYTGGSTIATTAATEAAGAPAIFQLEVVQ